MITKLLLTVGLVFLVRQTVATEVFAGNTLSPAEGPQQTRNSIGDEANEVEHLVETLNNVIEKEDRAAEPEGGGLDADPPVEVMEELEKEEEREIDELAIQKEKEMAEELGGGTSMGGGTEELEEVRHVVGGLPGLVRVCEHQTLTITCPAGRQINLVSALYGRTSQEFCPHSQIRTTNCQSSNSLALVSTSCQGKSSCSVGASNSVFGDPCVGTFKYLEVRYTCIGCEHYDTDTQYRYRWNLPPLTGSSFTFEVQANNDAHVALSSQNQDLDVMYEIVIGGWRNTQSVVRRGKQGHNHATVSISGINSPTEYRSFWITWSSDGTIAVGKGDETEPFMQWTDPDPLPIAYAGYSTGWGSTGRWKFCNTTRSEGRPTGCRGWTRWYDRDNPSATGDWENLSNLRQENPGQICAAPSGIQARVKGANTPASQTGRRFSHFNPRVGFVCQNNDQSGSNRCLDYEVRFWCP